MTPDTAEGTAEITDDADFDAAMPDAPAPDDAAADDPEASLPGDASEPVSSE